MTRRPSPAFDFSPPVPGKRFGGEVGPNTNRGQKGGVSGFAVGIDWLTFTFPMARLEECSATNMDFLGAFLFGANSMLRVLRPTGRHFQFYTNHCLIMDREGEMVGRVAFGGNRDTMMVDLTGTGCRWVKSWSHVKFQLEVLSARISRCDVAVDDFDGVSLDASRRQSADDLRELAEQARGGLFKGRGRPPLTSFRDDHGSRKGCTLYVGQKGHNQLCMYEKGREQGDETSPWLRYENRFYGKHVGDEAGNRGVPLDILSHPLRFFRGAHAWLAALCDRVGLVDLARRAVVVKAKVEATAKALVQWMRTQVGPSLNLVVQALGDEADAFVRKHLTRDSLPSRFKGLGAAEHLQSLVRQQLCHVST